MEASSRKAIRHRLNRGGDAKPTTPLWVITLTRLCIDPATRTYTAANHRGQDHSEIMRLLERYLARKLFPLLKADFHHAQQLTGT